MVKNKTTAYKEWKKKKKRTGKIDIRGHRDALEDFGVHLTSSESLSLIKISLKRQCSISFRAKFNTHFHIITT